MSASLLHASSEPAQFTRIARQVVQDTPFMALFGGLASIAYYLLWVQQQSVGAGQLFAAQCFPSKGGGPLPLRIPYTGNENVDIILCLMASFFYPATHDPSIWAYNLDLVGSLAVELVPFFLDASTVFGGNRILSVTFPLFLGLIYTFNGGAVVLPLWWLLSIIVQNMRSSFGLPPRTPDTTASWATAFAVTIGYLLPGILMVVSPTPKHIALWILFPLTIAAAQICYYVGAKFPVPSFAPALSSYQTIQLTYIALGLFSICTHIPLLWTIFSSRNPLESARLQLVPYFSVRKYESKAELQRVGLQNEIRRFLQWDHILIAITTWIVGTWPWAYATPLVAARVTALSLAGSFLVGPGAVVACVFVVKESMLQYSRVGIKSSSGDKELIDLVVRSIETVVLGRSLATS
ncbi:hypothetical protein DL93DRAFT_2070842 [Clavulina sp. PMI_390]|nr:hypothetical protein DL93DRAFT_2070842 [Clavulina sp. PMI_390]